MSSELSHEVISPSACSCSLPFHVGYPPLLSADDPSSNSLLVLLDNLDYCKERILRLPLACQ
jgi:hypothetical protein